MLGVLGFLALAIILSIIVYKVFFGLRKKHIGSGNIFYISTGGKFSENIEITQQFSDNLRVLTQKNNEQTMTQEAILVHEFTNKHNQLAHKILVQGMPIGYLNAETAAALKKEKDELGIHAGVIYTKVQLIKDEQGKVASISVDIPPINILSKVLSNRSYEHSLARFLKIK